MITIHCEPGIPWQAPFAHKMSKGLKALGIEHSISGARDRQTDVAILLGTSMWRAIERDGSYLLIDRASFGDPLYVSLVWNGHGRRGDHKVPKHSKPARLNTMIDNKVLTIQPWREGDVDHIVLAGQIESYSPHWRYLEDWYRSHPEATHFRPHPAQPVDSQKLPVWQTFEKVGRFITLNSSVAIDAIMSGVPTIVDDEGGMAWPGFSLGDDRVPWLRWLAYTQWSHEEIEQGLPIRHLFDGML